MEHITKSLSKYGDNKKQIAELDKIRAEIVKSTGINPVSLKIKNQTLFIKVNNQYEALEIINKESIILEEFPTINRIRTI